MKKDNPGDVLSRETQTTLYPNQPSGRTIFHEVPNLSKMDEKTLRGYMERVYVADNFLLTVGGNISLEDCRKFTQKYFVSFRSGNKNKFQPSHIEKNEIIKITPSTYGQSKLNISFTAFPADTVEELVAGAVGLVLGGGFSSRLTNRLRHEKHLVYSISAFADSNSDSGSFSIRTYLDEANVQRAINEIYDVVKIFLSEGLTDGELEKIKNTLLSNLSTNMERLGAYADFFATSVLFNRPVFSIQEWKDRIIGLDAEFIMSIAKKIFSDKPKVNLLTKNLREVTVPNL